MLQNSNLGRTFLFLTELAWKNRVALPALIMVGCMVFNFRWEIEINIHTERIALQDLPGRPYVGGAFGGIAIEGLDYTDDEDDDEDDDDEQDNEYYDTDYDEEEDDDSFEEDDDLYYSSYDEDDEDGGNDGGLGGTLNGMIRINRYAVVNFHNARR
ncbi:phosphatidylinositol 4-phosphate 5-kinase-like [Anopheles ziemanni]|uniref:phosphatidylinositol 4-phosphate 5-kinase-like n=1 Tax=Anopheles coustani TaxID=139045 RepID=UPI0026593C52|nr:phosphatidylinositol 4-phosphate 5-kinase-like [Anopheles coustani]XP_058177681.1 phosphatidylinositol 4-phosphate 5-kinase-like [Anopheles ziemanni]